MSERAQIIIVWWALAFMVIFALAWLFLLHMIPPPAATLTADQVAAFYTEHSLPIRLGAMIASWTSAFMLPLSVVIGAQMYRVEKGVPVWSILQVAGGAMMSIFLVLPPLFWGVAAFTPTRPAEVTTLMHELGLLTLVTTDQYYIFNWVAIAYISLAYKADHLSPFPRWFGYFTIWTAFMFEAGAIAFIPKTGPFSWNGLLVFWSPLTLFFGWIGVVSFMLLRSLKRQQAAKLATNEGN
jgi:hypothetical protein